MNDNNKSIKCNKQECDFNIGRNEHKQNPLSISEHKRTLGTRHRELMWYPLLEMHRTHALTRRKSKYPNACVMQSKTMPVYIEEANWSQPAECHYFSSISSSQHCSYNTACSSIPRTASISKNAYPGSSAPPPNECSRSQRNFRQSARVSGLRCS